MGGEMGIYVCFSERIIAQGAFEQVRADLFVARWCFWNLSETCQMHSEGQWHSASDQMTIVQQIGMR